MRYDDDFMKYCLDNYQTPLFTREEFDSDLNKIIILKKMFKRYLTNGNINERLVLNNIIILINVFGIYPTNVILFYRLEDCFHPIIKSFLIYLDVFKDNSYTKDIDEDPIIQRLLTDL